MANSNHKIKSEFKTSFNKEKEHDVFICHAFEDKDFAGPLANCLTRQGVNVWYDDFVLTVGDSLVGSINKGLASSRFGIIVLSPNSFNKEWVKKEIFSLFIQEIESGEKGILPIWHNVSKTDVVEYLPMLADKYALDSSMGILTIVKKLMKVIRPEKAPRLDTQQALRPRKILHFVGRQEGREKAIKFISKSRPFVICGMGGIGKTSLASEIAYYFTEENVMPCGVHWCDIGMNVGLEQAIQIMADRLNIPEVKECHTNQKLPYLARCLREKKTLLVLDNVFSEELLESVLEYFHDIPVLLTTRKYEISGQRIESREQIYFLNELSANDAQQLLIKISGVDKSKLSKDEELDIMDICKLLGNHPMAITAAGARKSKWKSVSFAHIKEDLKEILDEEEITTGGMKRKLWTVTRVLETNYNQLRKNSKQALRFASAFHGSFSIEAFNEIMQCPSEKSARLLLQDPVHVSLINYIGNERFDLHDLTRDFAWHKLDEAGEKETVMNRFVAYYSSYIEKLPVTSNKFTCESKNIFATFDYSCETRKAKEAVSIMKALSTYLSGTNAEVIDLDLQGSSTYELRCELWHRCVELCRNSESPLLAHVLWMYSRSLWAVSKYTEAEKAIREGLGKAIENKDVRTEAGFLYSLATSHLRTKDPEEALVLAEKGLKKAREIKDEKIEGLCLHRLGWIHFYREEYGKSIAIMKKANKRLRKSGTPSEIVGTLCTLAHFLKEFGKVTQATRRIQEALELARSSKNPNTINMCLYRLGSILDSQDKFEEALECYEQFLSNKRAIRDKNNIGIALHAIGYCKFNLGQHTEAEELFQESLEIKREINDPRGIAPPLEYLGKLAAKKGNLKKAKQYWLESLEKYQSVGAQEARGVETLLKSLSTRKRGKRKKSS